MVVSVRQKFELQTALRRIERRPFYVVAALTMALIAALGFLPRMLRAAFNGTIPHDWVIHTHVAVYWIWLALFFAQTVNAALGRVQAHKTLGKVLITYGVVMFCVGVGVTLNRTWKQIQAGDVDLARAVNLAPVVDMLVFPVLFALAVHYRYKPELHKRLMILTATQLLYPAVVRMGFLPKHNWVVFLVWSSPVLLGIAHELVHTAPDSPCIRRRSRAPAPPHDEDRLDREQTLGGRDLLACLVGPQGGLKVAMASGPS